MNNSHGKISRLNILLVWLCLCIRHRRMCPFCTQGDCQGPVDKDFVQTSWAQASDCIASATRTLLWWTRAVHPAGGQETAHSPRQCRTKKDPTETGWTAEGWWWLWFGNYDTFTSIFCIEGSTFSIFLSYPKLKLSVLFKAQMKHCPFSLCLIHAENS